MKPRSHSLAAYARIEEVCKKRLEVPTDKQLSDELQIPVGYVRWLMWRARKRISNILQVSTQNTSCENASPEVPRNEVCRGLG
jgi:hypothetical protein